MLVESCKELKETIKSCNARIEGRGRKKSTKSLTRRSSNIVSLVMNEDAISDEGTSLFIAATLLQRELVETLVEKHTLCLIYAL